MAHDGKMFESSIRKGELFELKEQLNANTVKDRKIALKRVVAAMSLGRDMSSLFPDVVKNTTGDLSMKKLVYLYIINYAHANADLSILIVNTFIKDSADPNPLIRALAIRTMALIPLDKITEYLCDPLHSALKDSDPYVRKTAAVCVAKLYDTNPTLAIEEGFVSALQNLISDGNPMTVANAVASLSEIAEASQTPSLLPLNSKTVPRFLSALSECTEWGQVFILDAISAYVPSDVRESDLMVERIIPRLQHINPSVVLAATRVLAGLMPTLDVDEKRAFLVKKMSAPLITLLKAQPELQYAVLRNISLLLRSFPSLLASNVQALFVSYADPPYVKSEKLDTLVQIADDSNCNLLLAELLEYVTDVDIWFSQKSVDTISQIALRLPSRAQQCVSILSDLLLRKLSHLTEQIAIATKDLTRAYPKQFNSLVSQLCESVEDIEDPNAKAALVWIIGEHAGELASSLEMLEIISTNIGEEGTSVQLQILTAAMKGFLLRGDAARNVVNFVVNFATEQSSDLDIRNRGLMYSRLIALGPGPMRKLVLSEKPPVSLGLPKISAKLHKELVGCLSSVAAVYQKSPSLFEGVKERAPIGIPAEEGLAEEDLLGLGNDGGENDTTDGSLPQTQTEDSVQNNASKQLGASLLDDLLADPVSDESIPNTASSINSSFSGYPEVPRASSDISSGLMDQTSTMKLLLSKEKGKGLELHGDLAIGSGNIILRTKFSNHDQKPMSDFAIQLNSNMFGFILPERLHLPQSIKQGTSAEADIVLDCKGEVDLSKGFLLQVAVKFSPGGVVYFSIDLSSRLNVLLDRKDGYISKSIFLSTWSSVPDTSEVKMRFELPPGNQDSLDMFAKKLESSGIFTVAKRSNSNPRVIYLSARLVGSPTYVILAEVSLPADGRSSAIVASRTSITGKVSSAILAKFNEVCSGILTR